MISATLHPPQTPASVLVRTRLEPPPGWRAGGWRLALFVAPAGYGKTTAMIHWYRALEAAGDRPAWLALDDADNDPVRLGARLLAAVETVTGLQGPSLLPAGAFGAATSRQPIADVLISVLASANQHVTVFLDDVHLIVEAQAQELLRRVLAHAPDNVGFVAGSRSLPALGLSDLRLRGRLLEFPADMLRFSTAEGQALFQRQAGLALPTETVDAVLDRLEGWPAGLQLVALSLRGHQKPEEVLRDFTGSNRHVQDYFGEAVLSTLRADMRTFLLQTSVLPRMSAELCNAVTGYAHCQSMLEACEALNLFVVPLDQERRWWRYHSLFADFLQRQLARDHPAEPAALRALAARWFAEHDDTETAIQLALDAGEWVSAAGWIASCAEELVRMRGMHATLLRWLRRLPEGLAAPWPQIGLQKAWSLSFVHRFDESNRELALLEQYCDRHPEAHTPRVRRELELQRLANAALADRVDDILERGEGWLRSYPRADWFEKGVVHTALGFACKSVADYERGITELQAAWSAFLKVDGHYGIAWAGMVLATLYAKQGQLEQAMAVCRRGMIHVERHLGARSHAVFMLRAQMAAMCYQRNRIAEAKSLMDSTLIHLREQSSVDPLIAGYQTMARILWLDGDKAAAYSLLDEGLELAESSGFPRLSAELQIEQFRLCLREGDTGRAQHLAQRLQSLAGAADEAEARTVARVVAWANLDARLALARNRPDEALSAANRLIRRARNRRLAFRFLDALILKALALSAMGDEREARRALDEALALAAPERYLRVFLDEGAPVERLIRAMLDGLKVHTAAAQANPQYGFLAELAAAFDAGEVLPVADDGIRNRSALSSQELRILSLAASGQSNKAIARALFVSVGTVKWHLHNIYTKLGAHNRTEAVACARGLKLL